MVLRGLSCFQLNVTRTLFPNPIYIGCKQLTTFLHDSLSLKALLARKLLGVEFVKLSDRCYSGWTFFRVSLWSVSVRYTINKIDGYKVVWNSAGLNQDSDRYL